MQARERVLKCLGRSFGEIQSILGCKAIDTERDLAEIRILFLGLQYNAIPVGLVPSDFSTPERREIAKLLWTTPHDEPEDVFDKCSDATLTEYMRIYRDGPYYLPIEENMDQYVMSLLTETEKAKNVR